MTENKRKVLYKSLSITFIPTILIGLGSGVLALMPKTNVVVDIELLTNRISFFIVESAQRMEPVRVESIVLTNFKEIGFSPGQLLYDGKTLSVKGKALVRPWENVLSPRSRFRGEGMRLVKLVVGIDSKVTFYKSEGEEAVDIKVEQESSEKLINPGEGRISLGDSFTLLMERCDLVNEKGDVLISKDENIVQRALEIFPSLDKTSFFVSDDQKVFRIVLEKPEKDVALFSNASIRRVNFNDYDIATGKPIPAVKSGTVKFKNIKKKDIPLESGDFIYISERDSLKVVKLWLSSEDNSLGISLSGAIDSFKYGKDVPIEQLPSLLGWLFSNKTLYAIITILIGAITQTAAVRKLIVDIKK